MQAVVFSFSIFVAPPVASLSSSSRCSHYGIIFHFSFFLLLSRISYRNYLSMYNLHIVRVRTFVRDRYDDVYVVGTKHIRITIDACIECLMKCQYYYKIENSVASIYSRGMQNIAYIRHNIGIHDVYRRMSKVHIRVNIMHARRLCKTRIPWRDSFKSNRSYYV